MFRPSTPSRIDQIWNEQKRKLQLQFTKLTDDDLFFETGRKHEMLERLSIKLGKSEAEIKRIFQAL
jgi:hypothetical protein